MVQEMSQNVSK